MSRAYLFIDIADRRATLVRLPDPTETDMQAEGRVYENVPYLEDFVGTVLDIDHGDASGVIEAAEMQGRDWSLEPIENEWYVTLRRVPEVCGLLPRTADFDAGDDDLLDRVRSAIATRAKDGLN